MHRKVHQNIIFSIQRVKRKPASDAAAKTENAGNPALVGAANRAIEHFSQNQMMRIDGNHQS
jgi:hypothetical protein